MRSNIETIKFTGRVCIALAVLTYIVTLNIDIGFFQPNLPWMSNNFALTVCGGAFASFLVVLLCEVQKYRSNKLACENYLYSQSAYLYGALFAMIKNIDDHIADQSQPVPDNLIDDSINMIRSQAIAIRSVDYFAFCKSNILTNAHKEFCSNELIKLDAILRYGYFLKIAISKTQISYLERTGRQGTITSADELVARTLIAIKKHVALMLEDVSNYLETIDTSCKSRFDWKKQKIRIDDSCVNLSNAGGFEDFLRQAEEKL